MDNNTNNQISETNKSDNWQSKVKSFFTGISPKTVLLILLWTTFLFTLLFANTRFLREMDVHRSAVDAAKETVEATQERVLGLVDGYLYENEYSNEYERSLLVRLADRNYRNSLYNMNLGSDRQIQVFVSEADALRDDGLLETNVRNDVRDVRRDVRHLRDMRAARSQTVGYYLSLNAFLLLAAIGLTVALEKKDGREEKKEEPLKQEEA